MSGVVTVSRALTPRNWTSTSDPTNAFDAADGVRVGDHWYNTASGNVFVCVTNTVGAAVWRHIPRILAASGAGLSVTGTTSETALVTIAIAAGVMGVNGIIRARSVWSATNNGNNKTRRLRFGASGAGLSGSAMLAAFSSGVISTQHFTQFQNRNSASSQITVANGNGTGGFTESTAANTTASIDTTAATEIVFSGTLANSADTCTLESYSIELFRPDIT